MREKLIAINRKATYNYFVHGEMEAGMVLTGSEVKSLRRQHVSLDGAYIHVDMNGQVEARGLHISPYKEANRFNVEPLRTRKLLLHKREIQRLRNASQHKGMTLIPLRLYLKGRWVKMRIGLCKGKKRYDKRRLLKEQEGKKTVARAMKRHVNNNHETY